MKIRRSHSVPRKVKPATFRESRSVSSSLNDILRIDPKSIMRVRGLRESLHTPDIRRGDVNALFPNQPSVHWNEVRIREYERVVGDNPSCSGGPPVSLGWRYSDIGHLPLELYENKRPPRRNFEEMVLPREERQSILTRDWGVSNPEIAQAIRDGNKAKNQRRQTVLNLRASIYEERMEGARRVLKRAVCFRKRTSRQAQDLIDRSLRAQEAKKMYLEERRYASAHARGGYAPSGHARGSYGSGGYRSGGYPSGGYVPR